jgi:hypothetical protein
MDAALAQVALARLLEAHHERADVLVKLDVLRRRLDAAPLTDHPVRHVRAPSSCGRRLTRLRVSERALRQTYIPITFRRA